MSQFLLLSTKSVLMIRSGRNQKMSLTTVECFDPHRVSFYLNQSKALRRWPWASDLKYFKTLHKVSVSPSRHSDFLHFKMFYWQVLSKSDKMFWMSGEIWSLICISSDPTRTAYSEMRDHCWLLILIVDRLVRWLLYWYYQHIM